MEQARIDEFKKKLDEVQIMAQSLYRDLASDVEGIRESYIDIHDCDAKVVSLCGVRTALQRSKKLNRMMSAVWNIERTIQANSEDIR